MRLSVGGLARLLGGVGGCEGRECIDMSVYGGTVVSVCVCTNMSSCRFSIHVVCNTHGKIIPVTNDPKCVLHMYTL